MVFNVRKSFLVGVCVVGLAAAAGTLVTAQPAKDAKDPKTAKPAQPAGQPADMPEMKLPPGWTSEDMEACMIAGQPGEMHKQMAKSVGVWHGKTTMWMGPGMEAMPPSECTSTITSMLDGRYLKCEMAGEIPAMGPYSGFGLSGFDNVSQKFVGTWVDNHSTGIMNGVGDATKDGKVVTWNYKYNCPITKKQTTMRQVDNYTGENTMSMEMFMTDPKSKKEYKCMHIEFTRK